MDLELFQWLLTEAGQQLLATAAHGDLTLAGRLRELERLRRFASPAQAAAAYEQVLLRQRALAKFPLAEKMYFIREALEQASGHRVASYHAKRFAVHGIGTIADLCCGIGGDLLAFATVAQVAAVDRDPLRLAIAQENARVLGLAKQVTYYELDLETATPPLADAIFFDPARREAGKRIQALYAYQPSPTLIQHWRTTMPTIGVKLAPGIDAAELAVFAPAEIELISVDGDLKECMLWLGVVAEPGLRATLINQQGLYSFFWPDAVAIEPASQSLPLAFLFEPDPAIIRAGLVAPLANQLGAMQIDPQIAYLTAQIPLASPFMRCWRILEWMPFHLKKLRARLREYDVGPVTVKKRGSPLEVDPLAKQLSGTGARPLVVVLTFVAGKPAVLICEGPIEIADRR